ncbi:nickel/cobalt transporter [Utexia brackfieldae]|uniref:nickel/cobalt transporter n=1 Tax=Utexia brackfieldae TaxID=3074108 RepID=UPI00370D5B3D
MPVKTARLTQLIVLLLILIVLSGLAYQSWPRLIFEAQIWQKTLHQQLTALLIAIKQHEHRAGFMLIGFSFLYGVIHSAGPGHGKMIITTYLTTQPTYYRQALMITLLSSLLQGFVAIIFIMLAINLFSLTRHELGLGEYWLTQMSYSLILLLGVVLCLRTLYQYFKPITKQTLIFGHIRPLPAKLLTRPAIGYSITPSSLTQPVYACRCGHSHLPSTAKLRQANTLWSRLVMILAMGIRPCSGAILVLIFAKMLAIFNWGMLAVLAMSVGTALTISIIAILVLTFRQLALRLTRENRLSPQWFKGMGLSLKLIGGIILVIFSLLLLLSEPSYNPILFGGASHSSPMR